MSVAAALRGAREHLRIGRAQAAVFARHAAATGRARPSRWALAHWRVRLPWSLLPAAPLLVPLCTWLGVQHDTALWRCLACMSVLLFSGQLFQTSALEFDADDVLRAPSKASVLLCRLWWLLPWLLFTGACHAASYAILLDRAIAERPLACTALLLAITASPVAATIGTLLRRLVVGSRSVLGPLLVPVIAAAVLAETIGLGPIRDAAIVTGALIGALGLYAMLRILHAWARRPREQLRVLDAELALLPRFLVACGLFVPAATLLEPAVLLAAAWCSLPLVLLVMAHALPRLVAAANNAEEATGGAVVQRVDPDATAERESVHARLPATHAGRRSLLRAKLYLHRRQFWFRPGDLGSVSQLRRRSGRILPMLVYHGWGLLLAAVAVASSTDARVATTLALLAGFTAPSFVGARPSWHLHRLGIDFVAQVRDDLRALAWFAAAPTLLAAAVAGTLCGWQQNRGLAIAVIAATFALRAGWRGLAGADETSRLHGGQFAVVPVMLAASLVVPLHSWWMVAAAAGIGLAGVALRLRRLDEAALVERMCALDEHVGAMRSPSSIGAG